MTDLILWYDDITSEHLADVGGKNASLGEMIAHLGNTDIAIPPGFATTSTMYWRFLEANDLRDPIAAILDELHRGDTSLNDAGQRVRRAILDASFPDAAVDAIQSAYARLGDRTQQADVGVAVRSSATAEDLPDASFAGQQESYLNIQGPSQLLDACRRCYASLFTDRAISYREQKGFNHLDVALSVGVQQMVRADRGGAGVAFTVDPDSGFPNAVVISAAFGLGEVVVQGSVEPDEYTVFQPLLDTPSASPIIGHRVGEKARTMVYGDDGQDTRLIDTPHDKRRRSVLSDEQILTLARWCTQIEDHYQRPMDIEWALDGLTDELFIVQARPETVQSQRADQSALNSYHLQEDAEPILTGISIGDAIAAGPARLLDDPSDSESFPEGAILVTSMTHPDWVPIMKRAGGIITELGGRTSHAAIVSRELGVPAIVGASGALERIQQDQTITLSCAGGHTGHIYDGHLDFSVDSVDPSELPETDTDILMNIANPEAAFRWWRMPFDGVGLARMEFIIEHHIQIHPMALLQPQHVDDPDDRAAIDELTAGYDDRTDYFIERLARGIASVAAAHHPRPIIVRTSDFKTNEYADLIGGQFFEPREDNPMIGFRGASRYDHDLYRRGFELECQALHRARHVLGFDNIKIMLPFVRTVDEADRVLQLMASQGLRRGQDGLQIYMMAEIPSNITLADRFAERFDGFSIGSNDLTQLILGVDRDSALLSDLFDERNEAITRSIAELIETAHDHDCPVGICGQAPSDHPDFAQFLVDAGIDSISINPDALASVRRSIASMEDDRAR